MLQEARSVFNATPINPRKCQLILTKLLFIICKGEHLGPNEATDTFFAMTKLFQCKDVSRRAGGTIMHYASKLWIETDVFCNVPVSFQTMLAFSHFMMLCNPDVDFGNCYNCM